jgi:hypothetical protein
MKIVWKQRLALTEEILCGAFVWKSDPVIAFLFQRHYSSALVLQEQSVNGEYCSKALKVSCFAERISAKGHELVVKYWFLLQNNAWLHTA